MKAKLPWTVQNLGAHRGYPKWTQCAIRSAGNVHIATVGHLDRYYEGEAQEHAEFIARAVNSHSDLVAALEACIDALHCCERFRGGIVDVNVVLDARAAIDKAEAK